MSEHSPRTGVQRIASAIVRGLLCVAISACSACAPDGPPATAGALEGYWAGEFRVFGDTVGLLVEVRTDQDGQAAARLDLAGGGIAAVPATSIELRDNAVRLEFADVGGTWEGHLTDPGSLEGDWLQAGAKFRANLRRVEEPPRPRRPQLPRPPFPYAVDSVEIESVEGITLAGTLTRPRGSGPAPAVVLVSGSGPQDRDETIFGHKPFWVIADHLTRAGIAVLRFDDRGVGGSTGDFGAATTADFATDAAAAVDYLASLPGIDADRVGVLGHSEGGWVAPMAAGLSESVRFLVLLAPVGMDGRALVELQTKRILEASGVPGPVVDLNLSLQSRVLDALQDPDGEGVATLQEEFREALGGLPFRAAEALGVSAEINQAIEQQLAVASTPWIEYFLTFDPAPVFAEVRVPVLALFGTHDLQVPIDPNLRLVREGLEAGGNRAVTAVSLPGLNHMFQPSETGLPSEYARIEQTIAPEALDAVTNWIASLVLDTSPVEEAR